MDHAFYRAVSQAEIAKIFDVNSAQVSNWVAQGMPHELAGRNKKCDSAKVYEWLLEKQITKLTKRKPKSVDDDDDMMTGEELFDDNLDKCRYYNAERAKLALEKEQGKLISRDDHMEFQRQAGDFIRAGFQSLPKKLAVKLGKIRDSSEIEALLEKEILDTLIRLSKLEIDTGE
jgi:phage terminase Nu1 subunit (DNA packaging protein)